MCVVPRPAETSGITVRRPEPASTDPRPGAGAVPTHEVHAGARAGADHGALVAPPGR